jgi:hypothetical protein
MAFSSWTEMRIGWTDELNEWILILELAWDRCHFERKCHQNDWGEWIEKFLYLTI